VSRAWFLAFLLAAVALVIAFALVTPPGEAPDEAAHVRYVRELSTGVLPTIAAHYDFENYEAHQPPLGYVLGAVAWRWAGESTFVFTPSPGLDFRKPGSRAVAPPITDPAQVRAIRILRLAQLPFVLIALLAICAMLEGRWVGVAYGLAPQLLFVFAVVNNDAAAIAFSSLTLLLLVRLIQQPSTRGAALAGIAGVAALFCKATTLFLLAPIAFAIVFLAKRQGRAAIALSATTTAGLAAWLGLNAWRFGALLPSVPSSDRGAPLLQLFTQPRWIGSLFRSFWAKFGWLNTPMVWPFYGWFAVLTLAAVFGAAMMLRRPETRPVATLLAIAIVDWQPQGRYLLTSIGAVAVFGAAATEGLSPRGKRAVAMTAFVIALCAAIQGVLTVAYWYGRS
jgi:hypothetical protein